MLDGYASVGVFGCEHGFSDLDEGQHQLAPTLVKAIFGQSLVKVWQQIGHLIGVVFQADIGEFLATVRPVQTTLGSTKESPPGFVSGDVGDGAGDSNPGSVYAGIILKRDGVGN